MSALEPRHLKTVEHWTMILALVATAAALVVASRPVAFAVAAGAGLMVANAWAIRQLAERLFRKTGKDGEPRAGAAVALFNVKMFVLIALVYVAVKILGLDAIGFLVGVSVFPVAVVIAALRLNLGADETDAPRGDSTVPNGTPSGEE